MKFTPGETGAQEPIGDLDQPDLRPKFHWVEL